MKKSFLMLLSFMFVATMSVMFISCGDDDDDILTNHDSQENKNDSEENSSGGTQTSTLSEEEKKFVGCWSVMSGANSHCFIFYPNGKAAKYKGMYGSEHGDWKYLSESKLLSTTIGLWQFDVNAIFDSAWTGTTRNTGRSVKADKLTGDYGDRDFFAALLYGLTYTTDESPDENVYMRWTDGDISNISITDEKMSGQVKYSWQASSYSTASITYQLTLEKPYTETPKLTIKLLSRSWNTTSNMLREGTYNAKWWK